VHGGVGASATATADVFVLDTTSTPWSWSRASGSPTSLATPALAWHSAVYADGTVVVGYGLDLNDQGATSRANEIYYLSNDADAGAGGSWTWATTYTPKSSSSSSDGDGDGDGTSSSSSGTGSSSSGAGNSGKGNGNGHGSSSNPKNANHPQGADPSTGRSPGQPTKTIVGALGGIFGAAILAGLAALFFSRRRRGNGASRSKSEKKGGRRLAATALSPPSPVSRLLFTHPVPQRILSLGSSASLRSTNRLVVDDQHSQGSSPAFTSSSNMAAVGANRSDGALAAGAGSGGGKPVVPLSRTRRDPGGLRRTGSQSTTGTASVTSYPFLTSVPVKRTRSKGTTTATSSTSSLDNTTANNHAYFSALSHSPPLPSSSQAPQGPSETLRQNETSSSSAPPPPLPEASTPLPTHMPRNTPAQQQTQPAGPRPFVFELPTPTFRSRDDIPGFLRPAAGGGGGSGGLRVVNPSLTSSSTSSVDVFSSPPVKEG
jgi:hypothetical protein